MYFVSIYDIEIQQWKHVSFEKEWSVVTGLRILDIKTEVYWAGLILKNNYNSYDDRIVFVRASDGTRGKRQANESCKLCEITGVKCVHFDDSIVFRPVEQKFNGEVLKIASDK